MSYKPKFCCQCGEKIERVEWKLLTSRRFCELCATEFGIHDKMPWAAAVGGIFIGLVGGLNYLRTPAAPNQQSAQFISRNTQNANKPETNQPVLADSTPLTRTEKTEGKTIVQTAPTQKLTTKKEETPSNTQQEVSYFCGAATKKGTPCSRRVKNGGRCWQHEGQSAILPQEKLIVGNN